MLGVLVVFAIFFQSRGVWTAGGIINQQLTFSSILKDGSRNGADFQRLFRIQRLTFTFFLTSWNVWKLGIFERLLLCIGFRFFRSNFRTVDQNAHWFGKCGSNDVHICGESSPLSQPTGFMFNFEIIPSKLFLSTLGFVCGILGFVRACQWARSLNGESPACVFRLIALNRMMPSADVAWNCAWCFAQISFVLNYLEWSFEVERISKAWLIVALLRVDVVSICLTRGNQVDGLPRATSSDISRSCLRILLRSVQNGDNCIQLRILQARGLGTFFWLRMSKVKVGVMRPTNRTPYVKLEVS